MRSKDEVLKVGGVYLYYDKCILNKDILVNMSEKNHLFFIIYRHGCGEDGRI